MFFFVTLRGRDLPGGVLRTRRESWGEHSEDRMKMGKPPLEASDTPATDEG